MKEMEKAMNDFKKGLVSEREALNAILTAIFKNRCYFCLEKLDEDSFSDYLLYLQERLPHFMAEYDPKRSKFSTYLRKICCTQLRSWYRHFYRLYARDMALTNYALEENMTSLSVDDPEEAFSADTSDESQEMSLFLKQINRKIPIQTKIMMLALKSASFLTPTHITKICKLAEISEDELYEKLEIINKNLDAKLERQKHLIQLQNEAYIIKKESDIQMSILNPESSHYRNAELSKAYHTKLWKSRLERSRSSHDVYPTNTLVSEVLDIPLGQVTHILTTIRNKTDGSNGKKEVSYNHGTIRSDRKCSQTEGASEDSGSSHHKDS